MANSLHQIEAEMKREITRFHKDLIGKGPGVTSVKVFENTILIRLQDALSPVELSILEMPEGNLRIKEIRDDLFKANTEHVVEIINKVIKSKFEDVVISITIANKEIYVLLILDTNIELNLTKKVLA